MDYFLMVQGRMRHQDMINEAQREAHFVRVGAIAPGLLERMAKSLSNLFARRENAAAKQTPRRLATK